MVMSPRDRVINALEGRPARPTPWVEHGVAAEPLEAAYGIKFEPLAGDPHSLEFHLRYLERQIRVNELTGRCNVEVPYYYTMAPRVRKDGSYEGALTDEDSLERLVFVEQTPEHWDGLRRLVDAKQDYAMNACITTGIGHVWQTMDLMAFSVATVENPDLLRTILQRYTEWTCNAVSVCNSIGIDFYWCFDDFAFKTSTVYSPQVLREIVMPYARTVAAEIALPWIWHSDGNYTAVLDDVASLGMNALNPLEPGCVDVEHIRRTYPHLALVGNVDVDLLARGTPEQVRAAVVECFRVMGRGGRFIPSTSNSIPGYARGANVRAMFDQFRECGGPGSQPGRNGGAIPVGGQ